MMMKMMMMMMMMMMMCKRVAKVPMLCVPIYSMKSIIGVDDRQRRANRGVWPEQ